MTMEDENQQKLMLMEERYGTLSQQETPIAIDDPNENGIDER